MLASILNALIVIPKIKNIHSSVFNKFFYHQEINYLKDKIQKELTCPFNKKYIFEDNVFFLLINIVAAENMT